MVTKQLTKETGTGGKIRMTTEELVKQICKEQGISVAKLAAALGQSRQNFYKKLQRDTLTAQEWQEAAKVLGVEFDQGFVLPDGTRMGVSEKSEKRTVLPLMGSAFLPGKAEETVKQFEDPKLQEIAWGELYFFRAQAESCIQSVEKYQTSEIPYCVSLQICFLLLRTLPSGMGRKRRWQGKMWHRFSENIWKKKKIRKPSPPVCSHIT